MKLVAMAIPVFMVLIVAELLVARLKARPVYRFSDALTDLACGVSSQVMWILLGFGAYAWVFESLPHWEWAEGSAWPWVLGLVGYDFAYYWFHRASHRVNLIWAAHVVHHQSEDYNLAVALRQSWFQPQFSRWFYLPLALMGVEPGIVLLSGGVSLLYQFWIHTQLIGSLGPLGWVLNTPSHHRVHHGINARYLDKNYGATLIVWDRMFGTFEPETEKVVYGVTDPLRSYNPWWANMSHWVRLATMSRQATGVRAKVGVWLRAPEYQPAGVESRPRWDGMHKFDPPAPPGATAYTLIQFCVSTPALALVMFYGEGLAFSVFAGAGGLLLVSTLVWGGLLEARAWARPLELLRLLATAAYVSWVVGDLAGSPWGIATAALMTVPFAAWIGVGRFQLPGAESESAPPATAT